MISSVFITVLLGAALPLISTPLGKTILSASIIKHLLFSAKKQQSKRKPVNPPNKVNPICNPLLKISTTIRTKPIKNISVQITIKNVTLFVACDVYFFTKCTSAKGNLFLSGFTFVIKGVEQSPRPIPLSIIRHSTNE